MQCTGYSVVRGTDVAAFDVEVIDVVDDRASGTGRGSSSRPPGRRWTRPASGPGSPARRSTAPTRRARSGASARSRSRSASTAARSCWPRRSRRSSATRSTRRGRKDARSTLARARPLAAPLTVTGLSTRLGAALQQAAAKRGRVVLATPAGPLGSFPVQQLRPGSAFGVGYASGDIAASAIGTVAYTDGDKRLGLRPPARRRRRTGAAAAGRVRVPRRQQPDRDRGVGRHVQVRGGRARHRDAHERLARCRRRARGRAPADGAGAREGDRPRHRRRAHGRHQRRRRDRSSTSRRAARSSPSSRRWPSPRPPARCSAARPRA